MSLPVLTGTPVITSVHVRKVDDLDGIFAELCVDTRGMDGNTPVYAHACVYATQETLDSNFFSSTMRAEVLTAYADGGYDAGDFSFPPVAQDTAIWDPATNAPYP